MIGRRVEITADLAGSRKGGLQDPIEPGHRSTLFVFERLGAGEEPIYIGPAIEHRLNTMRCRSLNCSTAQTIYTQAVTMTVSTRPCLLVLEAVVVGVG